MVDAVPDNADPAARTDQETTVHTSPAAIPAASTVPVRVTGLYVEQRGAVLTRVIGAPTAQR